LDQHNKNDVSVGIGKGSTRPDQREILIPRYEFANWASFANLAAAVGAVAVGTLSFVNTVKSELGFKAAHRGVIKQGEISASGTK
jgi:hypothetical protein